jgi:hypothetical protein
MFTDYPSSANAGNPQSMRLDSVEDDYPKLHHQISWSPYYEAAGYKFMLNVATHPHVSQSFLKGILRYILEAGTLEIEASLKSLNLNKGDV